MTKNKLYYQFAGSCFLLLFAALTYIAKFYPTTLKGFDTTISQTIQALRPQGTAFFSWVTKFANVITMVILTIAIIAVLIYGQRKLEAIWLSAGMIGVALALTNIVKVLVHRLRPSGEHLVHAPGYSFPSGHSSGSMVLYGTLIFFVPLFIHNKTSQRICQVILGLFILLIGCSRIYLGVHYPSDVLAGYSLGLGWLLLTYPIYAEKRFIQEFNKRA